MKILKFKLNGLSSILMHNPNTMKRPTGEIEIKVIPSAEDEAASSRYIDKDGNLCVLAVAVLSSLIQGGKGYKIGKMSAAGVLAGAIVGKDGTFPLLRGGKPLGQDQYVIDSRRAVVQRKGIIRSRAEIELPWELECYFDFNEEVANVSHVKTALVNAGQTVGILDGRPKVKGSPHPGLWFGRFEPRDIWLE